MGEVATGVALVDLAGADDLVLGILNELIPMGEPSSETGQSEHDGEHLGGDSEGLVDNSGVEIDVGVQLSLDEVLVRESNSLKLHGDINHALATNDGEDVVGKLADEAGTWVKVLVDTMTESHEDLLAILDILDKLRNVLNVADGVEHAEHSLVSTTVARSIESSDSASKRSVDISLTGSHVADSGSGAVKLVLGVQDEQNLDSLDDLGVRAVVDISGKSVHHVKEVLNVTKVLLGSNDWFSHSVTVASSCDSWGAANDSVDMLVSLLTSLVDVGTDVGRVSLGVEGAHSSHQGGHHSHGVGVVTEGLDEWGETVMISGVLHDLLGEALELLTSGKFTVNEEEGSLEEVGVLSELFNGIAAVLKNTLLTVDEGDAGDAVDSVHVGGIVRTRHGTRWALDLRKSCGIDSSILDVELVLLASTVVDN